MNIIFTAQRRDDALTLVVSGDTLTINGEAFDFSIVPAGATLPFGAVSCELINGPVERDQDGTLSVPIVVGLQAGAPAGAWIPAPRLDVPDGPVDLIEFDPEPAKDEEAEE